MRLPFYKSRSVQICWSTLQSNLITVSKPHQSNSHIISKISTQPSSLSHITYLFNSPHLSINLPINWTKPTPYDLTLSLNPNMLLSSNQYSTQPLATAPNSTLSVVSPNPNSSKPVYNQYPRHHWSTFDANNIYLNCKTQGYDMCLQVTT